MKIIIAYGSPGSGKSTLLHSLGFPILDLDKKLLLEELEKNTEDFLIIMIIKQ